jgi:hypothetical protein
MTFRLLLAGMALVARGRASEWCSDELTANDCTKHTDLVGVHTCVWCETDALCHEVKSAYDLCLNSCCASKATLSSCNNEQPSEIDAAKCAGTVETKSWTNAEDDVDALTFPDDGVYPDRASLGITFSGGGARAFSFALGATRGLSQSGALARARYFGSVSGGSWFASAFVFDQRGYDDAALLCPYSAPEDLTLDALGDVADGCLAGAPSGGSLVTGCLANLAVATVNPYYHR